MSGVANKCFNDPLAVYTIHRDPEDHPGKWVVRQRNIPGGGRLACAIVDSLEQARAAVPFGLINLAKMPGDEPDLFETWI